LGMTSDDLTFLSDCNFVETAMPAYVTDIQLECKSQNYVTRIYGTPLINGKSAINTFQLIDGRLPQNSSECVISSTNNYHENPYGIGDTFTISSENKNYEKLSDTYAFNSLTVVGIVKSPCYISIETEPSSVGTGTVGIIMFVMPDCYNLEAYTDLFLKIKGAAALDTFSDKYFDLIDESIDKLEDIGIHRSEIRYNSVVRDATDKLDEAKNKYDEEKQKADTELADARKKLDDGKKQLEEATTSLSDAKKQFELLKPSLSENQIEIYEAQIKDSEAIIIENTKKLADGDKEYAENYEKAQTELANAKIKIDSAQKDISAIKIPEWYVSDRRDTVSFASYRSNSNKVAAIARVFPIFFFLVAALVALTTMTRMIDEERMQIGTLKALGYSKSKILMYYLFYGISASFIGGLAGAIMGFKIFPIVISNAYGILYSLPKTITLFYADYAVFTISIAVACTVLATLGACLSQLYEKPSTLLLPKAPKAGKRIFLEHIGIIWKHLGF
ncbi:MAG: FtsX-like permease family protein, partial [Clostridia bacterium]